MGRNTNKSPILVEHGLGTDALTVAASAVDRASNNFVNEPDRWVLTPFRSAQSALGRNLFVDSAPAHEAFVVMFAITVFLSLVDAIWYFRNARKAKTLEQRLIEGKFGAPLPISYELPNPVYAQWEAASKKKKAVDEEAESTGLTEAEEEPAPLLIIRKEASVQICAETYAEELIRNPQTNKDMSVPTYALLIRVTEANEKGKTIKRYLVAKRAVAQGEKLNDETKQRYIKELLEQWKQQPPSFFQKLNALWKSSSYMDVTKSALSFLFNFALWYWVVWFIAAGFVGFTGALTLAGGSPIIAFVIPAVVTVAWYIVKFIAAYRKGNFETNAAHAEKMNQLAEDLVRINAAGNPALVAAVPALVASGVDEEVSVDCDSLRKKVNTALAAGVSKQLKDKVEHILQMKSDLDTSVLDVTNKSELRKRLTGARVYVAYFIIFSFLAWVFSDFLSVFGIVATSLPIASAVALIVVPMVIALVGAIVFARTAYKEASNREQAVEAKVTNEKLKEGQNKFEHLVEEVKLRYAYLVSQGQEDEIKKQLNLPELMKPAQTMGQKLYAGFSGVSAWIGSAGAGSLLARLFLGLFAGLAQIGLLSAFSYTSAAFIVPVVLLALVWGGVSIINYYQQERLGKLEQLAARLNKDMTLYEHANECLKGFEKRLLSPVNEVAVVLDDSGHAHPSPGDAAAPAPAAAAAGVGLVGGATSNEEDASVAPIPGHHAE